MMKIASVGLDADFLEVLSRAASAGTFEEHRRGWELTPTGSPEERDVTRSFAATLDEFFGRRLSDAEAAAALMFVVYGASFSDQRFELAIVELGGRP